MSWLTAPPGNDYESGPGPAGRAHTAEAAGVRELAAAELERRPQRHVGRPSASVCSRDRQGRKGERHVMHRKDCRGWCLRALGLALLAGCTTVTAVSQYGGTVPRPDRILVYDLAVSPGEVALDRGVSARIQEAASGNPRTVQEMEVGDKVARALSEHLVKKIRDMGLPAQRAIFNPPTWGRTVTIAGAFRSIDEGNRTERVVIGLGAGRTDVKAVVSVSEVKADGPPLLLQEFEVDAKSSLKPGMAETMGVGAAAGTVATTAVVSAASAVGGETFGDTVEADASRAASNTASQLKPFFARQGWITRAQD